MHFIRLLSGKYEFNIKRTTWNNISYISGKVFRQRIFLLSVCQTSHFYQHMRCPSCWIQWIMQEGHSLILENYFYWCIPYSQKCLRYGTATRILAMTSLPGMAHYKKIDGQDERCNSDFWLWSMPLLIRGLPTLKRHTKRGELRVASLFDIFRFALLGEKITKLKGKWHFC